MLVDSEDISNRTLTEMLAEIGLPMTREESSRQFRGRSMASILATVEERTGRPVPAGFLEENYQRMERAFRVDLRPVPGILEALDGITLPTCVASSGPHRKMQVTLGVTGLLPRFEGRIFSATEVDRGKPYPDLFLYAAERMGAAPGRCVVIEDALPGVQAAVAAGMDVFGYARETTPRS